MAPGAKVWLLTGGEYERAVELPVGLHHVDVQFTEVRKGRHASPPSAALKQARGIIARNLAISSGAGRSPDGLFWEGLRFTAGLRDFALEEANSTSQLWRAVPAA